MRLNFTLLFSILLFTFTNAQFIEHVFNYDNDDYPYIDEVKLADMDGDGDLDYVTLGHQNRTITIAYHNDFSTAPNLVSFVAGQGIRNLILHDFDQDGDVDIIGSAPFDDKSFWWSNDNNGMFMQEDFPIADYNSLLFTDMNGDEIIDMVAQVDKALIIYDYSNGTVSLRKEVDFDSFGFTYKALTTFDENNDGLPEILAADASDGIILYEQSSADNFIKTELLPDIFSVEKLEVGDLNDDGHFDIVASSTFNGTCKIQMNQGDETFVEENIEPQTERIRFSNLLDFDNDGDLDIVYYDVGFGIDGIIFAHKNLNGIFVREALSLDHIRLANGTIGDIDGNGGMDMVFGNNPFFETELVVFENTGTLSAEIASPIQYDIFPTIVSDNVSIVTEEEVAYNIIDQFGSIVRSGKSEGVNLMSLDNFNSGVFFIQLQSGNYSITQKIVKVDY